MATRSADFPGGGVWGWSPLCRRDLADWSAVPGSSIVSGGMSGGASSGGAAGRSEVLERFQHSPLSFYENPEGFGEKLGEDLLGKLRSNKTVWAAVQERRIDLRDILQIGISRFLDAEDDEGTLCGLLAGLKSGEDQAVRAEDVSGWIERFGIGPATPSEVKTGVYRLAVRHGGDFAAQIPRDAHTMRLANGLSRAAAAQRRSLDVERRLILFGAQSWPGPRGRQGCQPC